MVTEKFLVVYYRLSMLVEYIRDNKSTKTVFTNIYSTCTFSDMYKKMEC